MMELYLTLRWGRVKGRHTCSSSMSAGTSVTVSRGWKERGNSEGANTLASLMGRCTRRTARQDMVAREVASRSSWVRMGEVRTCCRGSPSGSKGSFSQGKAPAHPYCLPQLDVGHADCILDMPSAGARHCLSSSVVLATRHANEVWSGSRPELKGYRVWQSTGRIRQPQSTPCKQCASMQQLHGAPAEH